MLLESNRWPSLPRVEGANPKPHARTVGLVDHFLLLLAVLPPACLQATPNPSASPAARTWLVATARRNTLCGDGFRRRSSSNSSLALPEASDMVVVATNIARYGIMRQVQCMCRPSNDTEVLVNGGADVACSCQIAIGRDDARLPGSIRLRHEFCCPRELLLTSCLRLECRDKPGTGYFTALRSSFRSRRVHQSREAEVVSLQLPIMAGFPDQAKRRARISVCLPKVC